MAAQNLKDLITYEEVERYYAMNYGSTMIPNLFDGFSYSEKIKAFYKIKILEIVFNDGWIANWQDRNQQKWYPYYIKEASSWVFLGSYYCEDSFSGQVGFYKDKQTADHVGRHFMDIYLSLLD